MLYHKPSITKGVKTMSAFPVALSAATTNWLKSAKKKSAILGFSIVKWRSPSRAAVSVSLDFTGGEFFRHAAF